MVVRTEYERRDFARLTYAEIFNPWAGVRTVINFYPRDPFSCSYQWVSDVFACQSRYLLVHIYGYDDHGQPIRRSSYTYCGAYMTSKSEKIEPLENRETLY